MERRVTSHTEEEEMNQRRHLLELARKGDQKAVVTLMELYQVRVYSGEHLRMVRPSRPVSSSSKSKPAKSSSQKPSSVPKVQDSKSRLKREVESGKKSRQAAPVVKKPPSQGKAKTVSGIKRPPKPVPQTKPAPSRSQRTSKVTKGSRSKTGKKVKSLAASNRSPKAKLTLKAKSISKKPASSKLKASNKSKAGARLNTTVNTQKLRPAGKSKVAAPRKHR